MVVTKTSKKHRKSKTKTKRSGSTAGNTVLDIADELEIIVQEYREIRHMIQTTDQAIMLLSEKLRIVERLKILNLAVGLVILLVVLVLLVKLG